jgi:hypothetical protein
MTTTSKKIIFSVALFFVAIPSFAFASVVFEQTPLFSNTNFAPGEMVSRHFTVTNETVTTKTVAIEAINKVCNTPCLADKLHMKISADGTEYFDDTLEKFFSDGERSLGTLSANVSRTYLMSVLFEPETGNDYQAKTASFDMLVGFRGEEGQSDNDTGNGSGGGGGAVLQGLQIQNEATIIESDNSITVSWTTNYSSYGHVIYGLASDGPYTLNLSEAHFGYISSTPSDPHLIGHVDTVQSSNHSFTLSGLEPGTYRYRVVSHASPPTVSYERTFIVPGIPKKDTATENETYSEIALLQTQNQGERGGLVAGASDTITEQENNGTETDGRENNGTREQENKNSEIDNRNLATVWASLSEVSLRRMFGIGLLAVILGFIVAKKMKK